MSTDQVLKDALTGALSRAVLQTRLREEIDRARRYVLPLALLIVDVDYFKSINDAFGHTRGDVVLAGFVERVRRLSRDSDLLFRYGGDEFVLLMPHTDQAQCLVFARRLMEAIQGTPFPGTPPLTVTTSIGVASFPADGDSPEDLFERADRRLYAAKRLGRAQVVAEDESQTGPLSLDTAAPLLEREQPLTALRQFLDGLPEQKRGLLSVRGPRGIGKTWFLSEVAKAARLRGYVVWHIPGNSALRHRLYGALSEAPMPAAGLPHPAAGEAAFVAALQEHLLGSGQAGLVLVVDNLGELDRATLELVRRLLFALDIPAVALVYTLEPESAARLPVLEAPLRLTLDLQPLTPVGVRLWLRLVLHWEPPEALCDWLHQQTRGLPGRLRTGVVYLLEQGVLLWREGGWEVAADYQRLPLAEALERQARPRVVQLPTPVTDFVGRDDELSELKQRVLDSPLVTLTGLGGMGKTRLAMQAAAELAARFSDGVCFVPLAAATAPEFVVSAVAQACGLAFDPAVDDRTRLLQALRDQQLLLVLDGLEHVQPALGLLAEIRREAVGVRLLVTSREPLDLPEEAVMELRGLPIPPAPGLPRGDLAPSLYSAEQLFVQSASRVTPDFTLAPDERLDVRRICQLVEGMPLAIELAAAWTPLFTCREIAAQIERSLDFLSTTRADIPLRQRSARAMLDSFWGLLADDERRRVRGLAVFRGGFGAAAAQYVAGASLFFLSALVDKAFLRKAPGGRYEMHELLRQYAAGELVAISAEHEQAAGRHSRYYASFLAERRAALKGAGRLAALAQLATELGNLRAAWEWATGHGQAQALAQSFEPLVLFYEAQSWYHEGAAIFARALEAWRLLDTPEPAPGVSVGRLLAGHGIFMHRLGQNPAAQRLLQEGLERLRQAVAAGQEAEVALAAHYLGLVAIDLGDYTGGQVLLREALVLCRQAHDEHGAAQALVRLGALAHDLGDYLEARQWYQEGLELSQAVGDQFGVVAALASAGAVALDLGQLAEAQSLLERAYALAKSLGHEPGLAPGLRGLARLAAERGELALAREHFETCLGYSQASGNQKEIALDLLALGSVALRAGDLAEARHRCEQGLALLSSTGYRRGLAMAHVALAQVDQAEHGAGSAQALHNYRTALQIADEIRALPWVLAALVGIAQVLARTGPVDKAVELLTFALVHPTSSRRTRDLARKDLSRLEAELPSRLVAEAETRGREAALQPLVQQALELASAAAAAAASAAAGEAAAVDTISAANAPGAPD